MSLPVFSPANKLVSSQSEACGSPEGRAASRTCRLIDDTQRLQQGTLGVMMGK